jgi:cardiolipin synthase A/B
LSNPHSSNSVTPRAPSTAPSPPSHKWHSETLYFDGDKYFAAALSAMDSAKEEVLLESYIFDLDTIGIQFLQSLERAVTRGLQVRLLVDGIGSYNWLPLLREECKKRNIIFRVYHPLPFQMTMIRRISWQNLRGLLLLFRRINKRNHRKVIMIDGEQAFLGSFNISQVHSRKMTGSHTWRDSGVSVRGDSTTHLRQAFIRSWDKSKLSSFAEAEPLDREVLGRSDGLFRINNSLRNRFLLMRDLRFRLRNAQARVLITNGYFLPRRKIIRALRATARRGVFVGICIPAKSDIWFVKAAARILYMRLIKDGVHIYEYQPTVLHAKTIIIDDWATVGSHNLNHRSLIHDLEVEAVICQKQNIDLLVKKWDEDVKNSKSVQRSDLLKIKFWQKWISRFAYWFRYWI